MDGEQDMETTDRRLVAAFLAGRSEAAFRLLYRRHTPRMLSLCRHLAMGSPVVVEDCVQEAWMRAVGALGRFGWRSSLSSWLCGFVVNVTREFRRAARAAPTEKEDASIDHGADPLVAIELADAVRHLPDGYRSVISLHDVGGFTHAEIAEILGIDIGTSKSQLARARQRLRAKLDPEEVDNG